MLQIEVTDRWHETFPGGHVGMLLIGNVDNSRRTTALDRRKREIESRLREKFAGCSRTELRELEVLQAYREYYRQFNKTYHVLLQLESVVQKGKSLPDVSPLVDANFAAELETLILTAGHDADLLEAPVTIDATEGGREFVQMNGTVRTLKPDDMMMSDGKGIICTIIYGQGKRTPISPDTRRALWLTRRRGYRRRRSGGSSIQFRRTCDSLHRKLRLKWLRSTPREGRVEIGKK
jgi:DNA/RNA-binding domain of Phe-tRNA-synthetase-like protein